MRKLAALALAATVALAAQPPGPALAQGAAGCTMTVTGAPDYPPLIYRDGEHLIGAAIAFLQRVTEEYQLGIPVNAVYRGPWPEAAAGATRNAVDILVAAPSDRILEQSLVYNSQALVEEDLVVLIAAARPFAFSGRADLGGRAGVADTSAYGGTFAAFSAAADLTLAPAASVADGLLMVLGGGAEYLIVGRERGLAEAIRLGVQSQIAILEPRLAARALYLAFADTECAQYISAFGLAAEDLRDVALPGLIAAAMQEWESRVAATPATGE